MPSSLEDASAITVISADDESAPKIWRNDVMMAVPCAMSSRDSAAQA